MDNIYGDEGDYAARSIIQKRHYGFKARQANFIKERLTLIDIGQGRKSMTLAEITLGERTQLRAVFGGMDWVQRETRPDQSGNAATEARRILKAIVQTSCDANKSVARLTEDP